MALARQRVRRDRARRVGRERPRSSSAMRWPRRLLLRAQDRRRGRLPHLPDGTLVTGATRGNGTVGEDVTANIRTIARHPGAPERARVAGGDRDPRRGLHDLRRLRAHERRPRRRRARRSSPIRATRRPAHFDRRTRATAKKPLRSSATPSRCRDRCAPVRDPVGAARDARRWGIPVAPHRRGCKTLDEVHDVGVALEHD